MVNNLNFDGTAFYMRGKKIDLGLENANRITCTDEITVGDLVLTKKNAKLILILYVDYEVENIGHVDFAGVEPDGNSDRLILLNRCDIDFVVKKAKDKSTSL